MTTADGRPLIKGQVDLYFRTSRRLLVMRIPGEPDRLFTLRLAANPSGRPISALGSASTRSPTGPAEP